VLGTAPVTLSGADYIATFTGLSLEVPANNDKVLTVSANMGAINSTSGSSGADMTATLASYKVNNSQGSETVNTPAITGNAMYVYKAIPTLALQTLPSTNLTAGTQTLSKFSVTSSGDTISWNKVKFAVTKSASSTIANVKLYDITGGTSIEVAGVATLSTVGSGNTSGTISFVPTTEESIDGSKTYSLKADIGGVIAQNDYITTSINSSGLGYLAPTVYSSVGATATFVWSDESAASHDTTTSDWSNDNLVKNIPTDSQTLTN
jgi:hypothetical protein